MGFTFYADLLGISNSYRLSSKSAHDKLNDFYDATFATFEGYFQKRPEVHAYLYSDSLLIWGEQPTEGILSKLHLLYVRLLQKGLFLRGALVNGSLQFEPRHELSNLEKRLPIDDTLARAVGLEKTKKGSRLLIENALAEELFEQSDCSMWKTLEGYVQHPNPNIPLNSIVRRICPSPNQDIYEFLYPWISEQTDFIRVNFDINLVKNQLKEVSEMLDEEISIHYRETIKLLDRAMQRKKYTEQIIHN